MKKILVSVVAAALQLHFLRAARKSSSSGITLEMYYYKQENQEGLKNIVKAFEKANPGITINTLITPNDGDSQMSARAAQGDLPDILQMQSYSRVREYASKGYLVDLSKNGSNIKSSAELFACRIL